MKRLRPLFLCEHLVGAGDGDDGVDVLNMSSVRHQIAIDSSQRTNNETLMSNYQVEQTEENKVGKVGRRGLAKEQSSAALLGVYKTLEKDKKKIEHDQQFFLDASGSFPITRIIETAIQEKKWSDGARRLFETLDTNGDAKIGLDDFVEGLSALNSARTKAELASIFNQW